MAKYYTWQDVALAFKLSQKEGKWPNNWASVNVFSDELELNIMDDDVEKTSIYQILTQWFGGRIDAEQNTFYLESSTNQPRSLKITLNLGCEKKKRVTPKPLFNSVYNVDEVEFPPPFSDDPVVFAFHSYKGGVGRTLSVLSFCRSLSKKKKNGEPLRLLIVDADYEAPGLTWLARRDGGFSDFSLLDALALIHEEDHWNDSTLDFISSKVGEELLRLPVNGVYAEHYFLPAYRDEEQLFSMPIEPKDLMQFKGREWIIGDFIHSLGKKLGVDAVVVDLRAGISEFSAPFLFDPRIQRVILSTTSLQSVEGNKIVMKQVMERMPREMDIYPLPMFFFSMVTEDATKSVNESKEEILLLYPQDKDREWFDTPDIIRSLPFAEELVHLGQLDHIDRKLSGTEVEKVIDEAVSELVFESIERDEKPIYKPKEEFLKYLIDISKKMEYAESDENNHFLKTIPIRNLAQKFSTSLPAAVVMGAKGSGKTFIYMQIVKKKRWSRFLTSIIESRINENDSLIIPLLSSRNLSDQNIELRNECLLTNRKQTEADNVFTIKILQEKIESLVLKGECSEARWQKFWLESMAHSIGFDGEEDYSLQKIQDYLSMKKKRVTFVLDGLEDEFNRITEVEAQQVAVRALCQGIVSQIRELPNSNIGVIVFVRKDIVQLSIPQNFGQFARLYDQYEMRWNQEEALRLVLWICRTVDQSWKLEGEVKEIEYLQRELIEKSLPPLWGIKLGKDDSREAYSANWVVSALSDFRGQLQARDIVRFLGQAARLSNSPSSGRYDNRYLQPNAIREAIDYCSTEKVKEIAIEIPVLEDIFAKIKNKQDEYRELPFDREILELSADEIKMLDQLGIVFKQAEGYYMPEIFRRALNMRFKKGARPKVIYLLKNALEKGGK